MPDRRGSPLDLTTLLSAVEAAAPIAAADVIGTALTEALSAHEVSFLIADYSGQALIRLSHVSRRAPAARGSRARRTVPLGGTPHGRAFASQQVEVVAENGGTGSSPR